MSIPRPSEWPWLQRFVEAIHAALETPRPPLYPALKAALSFLEAVLWGWLAEHVPVLPWRVRDERGPPAPRSGPAAQRRSTFGVARADAWVMLRRRAAALSALMADPEGALARLTTRIARKPIIRLRIERAAFALATEPYPVFLLRVTPPRPEPEAPPDTG